MAKYCEKCSLLINMDTDVFTVCEGKCAKFFHAGCVGVTEANLCTLSKNIIWMCDPCMALFCRWRESTTVDASSCTELPQAMDVNQEINVMKSTVAEIVRTLADVIRLPDPVVPVVANRHSTPASSPKLHDGSIEIACCASQTDESGDFSLYLTNIHNSATENDISMMVSRSLSIPISHCKDVVKLVPKWKNVNTMEYVSFKVVLSTNLKRLALKESVWPKGIKYREFVSRLNETWKPFE